MRTRLDSLCRMHLTGMVAAMAIAATLALTNTSARADIVWNVNIGNNIDETDNFVGAAPENTLNSTWNSATTNDFTGMLLADSTGSTGAGVTLDLNGATYGGYAPLTGAGDEIFDHWTKSPDNSTPFSMVIGNLSSGTTYDLVIYSEWFWNGASGFPVTQTAGTGLAGTIYVNRDSSSVG